MRERFSDYISLDDLLESSEVESKKAHGARGQGLFPANTLESYSAFANTNGGWLLLGIQKLKNQNLQVIKIPNTKKIVSEFWSAINHPKQVSANILINANVEVDRVGEGRGCSYQLPSSTVSDSNLALNDPSSELNDPSSELNDPSSELNDPSSELNDKHLELRHQSPEHPEQAYRSTEYA